MICRCQSSLLIWHTGHDNLSFNTDDLLLEGLHKPHQQYIVGDIKMSWMLCGEAASLLVGLTQVALARAESRDEMWYANTYKGEHTYLFTWRLNLLQFVIYLFVFLMNTSMTDSHCQLQVMQHNAVLIYGWSIGPCSSTSRLKNNHYPAREQRACGRNL